MQVGPVTHPYSLSKVALTGEHLLAGENDPAAAELPSLAQVANGVAGRETTADTSASSTSLAFNSHFGEAAAERTSPDRHEAGTDSD